MKYRATVDQQIDALKARGVTFVLMGEEEARRFLSENSYYFKLKAYRNNYEQTPDGKYVGLDFKHLVELSNMDFTLSRTVLSFALGIEHALKVRTNNLMMSDPDDEIAEKCLRRAFSGDPQELKGNPYTDSLIDHCGQQPAMWHLWELGTFAQQVSMYKSFFEMKAEKAPLVHLLFIVRKMRNAVSHGNCLLVDVSRGTPAKTRKDKPGTDTEVTSSAMWLCNRQGKRPSGRASGFARALDRLVVNNFAALLVCHVKLVDSANVLHYACEQLGRLAERLQRNRVEYFGVRQGMSAPQNHSIDTTLGALVDLTDGYRRRAREKIRKIEGRESCQ